MVVITCLLSITFQAQSIRGLSTSISALWRRGLGQPLASNIVKPFEATFNFYEAVTFANMFQLLFSFLYLLYNRLLTTLLITLEWSGFGSERKALRVSSPEGVQRSSYFLSLPYKFGLPLVVASSVVHWLISQSIFLIATIGIDSDGNEAKEYNGFVIGYSSIGIILSLIVALCMILALGGVGLMKYPGDHDGGTQEQDHTSGVFDMLRRFWTHRARASPSMDPKRTLQISKERWAPPMTSTCSAAISSACHRPTEDEHAHLFPVKWGDVAFYETGAPEDGIQRRCCFTTAKDVAKPLPSIEYR